MGFINIMLVIPIVITCLINVSSGRRNEPLPFSCPKVVDGGIDPKETDLIKARLTDDRYRQYRAATALVPCAATAQKAYLEENLDTSFTVAVAYIYNKPIEDLKDWLEEKFTVQSYENPIKKAVSDKCGDNLIGDNYGKYQKLSGDQLFNILCNNNCSLPAPTYAKYGVKRTKRSEPGYTLPYTPEVNSYNAPPAQVHHGDNAYAPIPPYPHVQPYHAAAQSYHPVQPYYKPNEIKFDDAPEMVYGWVIRTRSFTPCKGEIKKECDRLEREGKVVQCNIPRFSDCDSEWRDCVVEIENYLLEENYYSECNTEEGSLVTSEVRELAGKCLKDRRCSNGEGTSLDASNQYFVGFRNETECNNSNQCTNDDIGLGQSDLNLGARRYKRDLGKNPNRNGIETSLPNERESKKFVLCPLIPSGTKRLATEFTKKYDGVNPNQIADDVDKQSRKQDSPACRIDAKGTNDGSSTITNPCTE